MRCDVPAESAAQGTPSIGANYIAYFVGADIPD
jgi:hypothetical protein